VEPGRLLLALRSGDFITRERIRIWCIALLTAYTASLVYLFATAHGANDYQGRPLGTDFSNVYVAGQSALHGDAASPFNPAEQYKHEQALFGAKTPFFGWHYPPFFLLIAAPLAAFPYLSALLIWQLATFCPYLASIRALLRKFAEPQVFTDNLWMLVAVAFPAVFMNITHGHNGFLSAALMAGGLVCLECKPVLAGVLFGLMAYKPQFGLMLPIALIAGGHWRTMAAAACTICGLAAITTIVFGPQVWPAFLDSMSFTRTVILEEGGAGFFKIQSAFAWVRMWDGSVALAYAVQGLVTIGAAFLLFRLWRTDAPFARKGAALCLAALLATPYSFDYDMMALAPAIALMVSEGVHRGFRSYERVALAGLWLMPLVARPVASVTLLPVGVPMMLAMFLLLTRADQVRSKTMVWRELELAKDAIVSQKKPL